MVWFLVDDVLPFHERVLRAGNAAMGLWVRGGSWCAGQLTDGFIPADVARTLGTAGEIRKLVAVGLWEAHTKDGQAGYLFHAWAEDGTGQKRQPTKAEVEERRRKDREKKQRQRSTPSRAESGRYSPDVSPGDTQGDTPGDSRGESLRTRPDQAIPTPPPSSEGGASAPPPHVENPGERPAPHCPKHPGGTDRPCRACGDARRAHDAWTPPPPAPRAPRFDPATYCEHLQLRGSCETCDYEARRADVVIRGPWPAA
jgi:hypothetical protein